MSGASMAPDNPTEGISAREVARRLGWSERRIYTLARSYRFLQPINGWRGHRPGECLWDWTGVERWARRRGLKVVDISSKSNETGGK